MKFAFGFEGYKDVKDKVDPRFTRLITRVTNKVSGKRWEHLMPYHKCTDEDLAAFPPPRKDSVNIFASIRSDPNRHLYCFDQEKYKDVIEIWGATYDNRYQRVEMILVPCNYRHTEVTDVGDVVSAECNSDKAAQMDFLGTIIVNLYVSEKTFQPNQYGPDSIQTYSRMI